MLQSSRYVYMSPAVSHLCNHWVGLDAAVAVAVADDRTITAMTANIDLSMLASLSLG